MSKKYNIAVVGATGSVGREMLNLLEARQFPYNEIYALSSPDSEGKEVSLGEDKTITISNIENFDFSNVDIVFSSTSSDIAEKYAARATQAGAIIIDNSSQFRLKNGVPLIVPEVNNAELIGYEGQRIIANPNCCVIPLVVALNPLHNAAKIKRVVVSTYQSASGAGRKAMDELYSQTKSIFSYQSYEPKEFPRKLAFNLIPQIGDVDEDGYSSEETKIIDETKKVMGDSIDLTVSCVRVPVFVGHCLSVNIEFENSLSRDEAEELLHEAEGVQVISYENSYGYITPSEIVGEDEVVVSRLRQDNSGPNCLNMWITSDNLRKGAALNTVQIGEHLINEKD
jgi:aspartate-semialdehyde dehydrogenase